MCLKCLKYAVLGIMCRRYNATPERLNFRRQHQCAIPSVVKGKYGLVEQQCSAIATTCLKGSLSVLRIWWLISNRYRRVFKLCRTGHTIMVWSMYRYRTYGYMIVQLIRVRKLDEKYYSLPLEEEEKGL